MLSQDYVINTKLVWNKYVDVIHTKRTLQTILKSYLLSLSLNEQLCFLLKEKKGKLCFLLKEKERKLLGIACNLCNFFFFWTLIPVYTFTVNIYFILHICFLNSMATLVF